jgi:hypothetical protein
MDVRDRLNQQWRNPEVQIDAGNQYSIEMLTCCGVEYLERFESYYESVV